MAFTIADNDEAFNTNQAIWMQTDINALVAGIGGDGVVSGCAVTAQGSPDMTLAVASGTINISGAAVAITSGNVTITAADVTNPRIDLVVVSNAGAKSVTAGTAAANPKAPDIPANSVLLAMVYVPANDTAIQSNQITDKRVIAVATTTGGGTLALGGFTLTVPATGSAALLAVANVFTLAQTAQRDNIAATSTDGLILTNATAAAAGVQQWSPRIRLTGQGWKTTATAASQTVDWTIENLPIQGTTNPATALVLSRQINAGGYTEQARFGGGINMLTITPDAAATVGIRVNAQGGSGANLYEGYDSSNALKFWVNIFGQVQTAKIRSPAYADNTGALIISPDGSTASTAVVSISTDAGANARTSGSVAWVKILPLYNQASGNAANTDLLVNRTQTAVGSGAQLLLDLQVGSVSRHSVINTGVVAMPDATAAPGTTPGSGGFLYTEAGALKYKGSGGTVTTLAPA